MEVVRRSARCRPIWHLAPLFLALGLNGCKCERRRSPERTPSSKAASAAPAAKTAPDVSEAEVPTKPSRSISLLDLLPECDIDAEGLVQDFGNRNTPSSSGYRIDLNDPSASDTLTDHGGSSYQRVTERRFTRDFWLDTTVENLHLHARVFSRNAAQLSASVDGKRLGRLKLSRTAPEILAFPRLNEALAPGRHTLLLEAHGRVTSPKEPLYELDWLSFNREEVLSKHYSPPTYRDLIADQELDSVPRRSIVLRAPNHIRCPLHVTGETRLNVSLGFWGAGTGTAEIAIVEEGQPRSTLHERKVAGGVGARWIPVSLDLSSYVGRVVGLELRAVRSTQGGRIAFGEPELLRPESPVRGHRAAKHVVVILASGLDRRQIPPFGPARDNTAISDLLRDAATFPGYRTPTTVPAGVLASLLTGTAPSRHRVEDPSARLGDVRRPLNEIIKQAGGHTAMFTAVPTSFSAFGFNSGWDEYSTFSPVLDLPAELAIVEGTRWLQQRIDENPAGPNLLLIHSRGMHPPWDVTREQSAQLLPADYGGVIDARRGGIALGRLRRRQTKGQHRLLEEDALRLSELMKAALLKQNAALGNLMGMLRRKEAWDDTLLIFAGDVATPEPPAIPFDPVGALREDQLAAPLMIKFPERAFAGKSYNRPVTTVDLTRTILESLDRPVPDSLGGTSLLAMLSGNESLQTRTLVSTLGHRYTSLTGVWLLSGELGSAPKLCQTDVDPMCVEDQFGRMPLTARAVWQWTSRELSQSARAGSKVPREPASIDPETAAALTVWGDIEN